MKTEKLKKEIINRIENTSDENLLENFLKFLNLEMEDGGIYNLSSEEEETINIAREQIRVGNFHSQKEVETMSRKWLEE